MRWPRVYSLHIPTPRDAVFSDTAVASSGEATLIAFRQRPDTRSFGLPTCGLSTANSPVHALGWGDAQSHDAVMADRTQARYGDQVQPDEVITDRTELVTRAVAWLQTGR